VGWELCFRDRDPGAGELVDQRDSGSAPHLGRGDSWIGEQLGKPHRLVGVVLLAALLALSALVGLSWGPDRMHRLRQMNDPG
jgi:hypothetical protein